MSNKVDMQEVNALKSNVKDSLESLTTQIESIKTSFEHLNSDNDFKGQTARNIKRYNENYHIETINRVKKINEEFKSSFNNAVEAFETEVDNDKSAIIDKNAIKEYKTNIKESYEDIEANKSRMNATIASVHDLTKAQTITQSSVKEKGDAFHKQVKETLSHFDDFQASHSLDASDLIDMITPVTIMSSKVKDMPANRAQLVKSSATISFKYKFYSDNNQISELSEDLEKLQDSIYGGKELKRFMDLTSALRKTIMASIIAGNGNMLKGHSILSKGNLYKLGGKKAKLINAALNTNIENVEWKRIVAATKFMMDKSKNLKTSHKVASALKMMGNYSDKEYKHMKDVLEITQNKNKGKLFSATNKAILDDLTSENISKFIRREQSLKETIQNEKLEFKTNNAVGKGLKGMRYASKAMAPIGAAVAIGTNFSSEKTLQRKLVGSAVDLGAMAATTGTSMAVGTAIGGPVGAGVGAVVGIGLSVATEVKVFNGKSITDITKDKANKMVSSIRQSEGWSTTKEIAGNLSNISTIKRGIGGFGKTLGGVFN
ncbi:T7SS effector LXG polymorphic toxin [Staphylococcus simulans]